MKTRQFVPQKAIFSLSISLQQKVPEFEVSSHPFKTCIWIDQILAIMPIATQMRCFVTVCCNPNFTRAFGLTLFTLYKLFKPSLVTWEHDMLTTVYCTQAHTSNRGLVILNDPVCCIPPSNSLQELCWAITTLLASAPAYMYSFAILGIIPSYMELQVTRITVISIYKQQSPFRIRQLDKAHAKRWCFHKLVCCPLRIPRFQVPHFPLQPHQLFRLLIFQSFNSSSGSLIVQWLFRDYIPGDGLSGTGR